MVVLAVRGLRFLCYWIIIDKPIGGCSVLQPADYTGIITVKCSISYNPTFMDVKWKIHSMNKEISGYPTKSHNVTTDYRVRLLFHCSCATMKIYLSS